jgi:hypothetical protein
MRNTIKDANLADKLSAEDKEAIEKAVDKVVEWLDHNQVRCVLCLQHSGWLAGCPAGGVVLGAPLVGKASAVAPAKCHAVTQQAPVPDIAASLPACPRPAPACSWLRRRRSHSSAPSWRACATPLSPSCTRAARPPRECPAVSPRRPPAAPAPRSRKSVSLGFALYLLPSAFCWSPACPLPVRPSHLGVRLPSPPRAATLGLLVPANQACKPAAAATHPAAHSLTPATPCPSFCSALQTNCTDREDELGPHSALVSREPRASQIDFELPLPCKTKQRNWAGEQQTEQSRAEQGPQAGRAGSSRTVAWQGQHW